MVRLLCEGLANTSVDGVGGRASLCNSCSAASKLSMFCDPGEGSGRDHRYHWRSGRNSAKRCAVDTVGNLGTRPDDASRCRATWRIAVYRDDFCAAPDLITREVETGLQTAIALARCAGSEASARCAGDALFNDLDDRAEHPLKPAERLCRLGTVDVGGFHSQRRRLGNPVPITSSLARQSQAAGPFRPFHLPKMSRYTRCPVQAAKRDGQFSRFQYTPARAANQKRRLYEQSDAFRDIQMAGRHGSDHVAIKYQ